MKEYHNRDDVIQSYLTIAEFNSRDSKKHENLMRNQRLNHMERCLVGVEPQDRQVTLCKMAYALGGMEDIQPSRARMTIHNAINYVQANPKLKFAALEALQQGRKQPFKPAERARLTEESMESHFNSVKNVSEVKKAVQSTENPNMNVLALINLYHHLLHAAKKHGFMLENGDIILTYSTLSLQVDTQTKSRRTLFRRINQMKAIKMLRQPTEDDFKKAGMKPSRSTTWVITPFPSQAADQSTQALNSEGFSLVGGVWGEAPSDKTGGTFTERDSNEYCNKRLLSHSDRSMYLPGRIPGQHTLSATTKDVREGVGVLGETILKYISEDQGWSVSGLSRELGLSYQTVYRTMKRLLNKIPGLITVERRGREVFYTLNLEGMRGAQMAIEMASAADLSWTTAVAAERAVWDSRARHTAHWSASPGQVKGLN